jgi:hypothetical protein
MRTDSLLIAALLLPALGGGAPPAAAQPGPERWAPLAMLQLPGDQGDEVHRGDYTVEAGQVVQDVAVIGGDLRVRGTVRGNAAVVGGNLILEESGVVEGDAVITGGRLLDEGGRVGGEMRTLDGAGEPDRISREVERAVAEGMAAAEHGRAAATEARHEARAHREAVRRGGSDGWFAHIGRGLANLFSALALGVVLAGIGAVLIFYARPKLETISDTLRTSAVRSGAVGLAATFLIIPAFVVMVVALAVSIIGIPLLVVAVPLYPLAVVAAAAAGLLAAAHAIGERTAEQRHESFDLRYRNSYAYLFTGVAILIAPLAAAGLIEITGVPRFLAILLKIAGFAALWVAATLGLGAVILSRVGTRRDFVAPPLGDPGFDPDPLFDHEPSTPGPHV